MIRYYQSRTIRLQRMCTNLFCCSSTVTDGRVAGRRQGCCSPFRAHRSSNRSRAARQPSFDPFTSPGTSPTPVLRIPGILQPPKGTLIIPVHVVYLNIYLTYKMFQERQTFPFFFFLAITSSSSLYWIFPHRRINIHGVMNKRNRRFFF